MNPLKIKVKIKVEVGLDMGNPVCNPGQFLTIQRFQRIVDKNINKGCELISIEHVNRRGSGSSLLDQLCIVGHLYNVSCAITAILNVLPVAGPLLPDVYRVLN